MSRLHLKHRGSSAVLVTLHVSVLGTPLSMPVSTSDPHGGLTHDPLQGCSGRLGRSEYLN